MIVLLNSLTRGGCGKSTNSVFLTHMLAERGYRVLFCDLDPQCSGTRILSQKGILHHDFLQKNIYQAMLDETLEGHILNLKENIDYIPGSEFVNLFELIMEKKKIKKQKFHYIRSLLKELAVKNLYDFVILDSSPSKSALNTALMAAATHHIVSCSAEIIAAEMIFSYLQDIKDIQQAGIDSEILGVSIGMKERTKLSNQIVKSIQEQFADKVFKTVIKRKSKIHEYNAYGYPTPYNHGRLYASDKKALYEHYQWTEEILQRLGLPSNKGDE